MGNLEDNMMKYWLVKVGNLFYAGGLRRRLSENDNAKSYEFTTEEEVAFVILFEDGANEIANLVGGTIVPREKSLREVNKLREKYDNYMESEKEIESESLKYITEEIRKYNNK